MSYYIRSDNIGKLYCWSRDIYRNLFKKNQPWPYCRENLLEFEPQSLGFRLGQFLSQHGFILEPKLENHDVFHVLTGIQIAVYDEIALQYYLLGNGKLSPYLILVILTGSAFYSEKWLYFWQCFQRGCQAKPFYDLEFDKLLGAKLSQIKTDFSIN